MAVLLLLACTKAKHHTGPRPKLEIVLVDDSVDPLAGVDEKSLPAGSTILTELIPDGPGRTATVHYGRIVPPSGETFEVAAADLRASLAARATLPPDHRLAIGPISTTEQWDHATPDAMRTYLLSGSPIVTETDVVDATARQDKDTSAWSITVKLGPEGAARFEDATRRNVKRRLAIVVEDRVQSAPVVQAAVPGGSVQITLGTFTSAAEQRMEAERLASGLGGG